MAYNAKYLRTFCTDLHQMFRVCRQINDSYESDIYFLIAQGMLMCNQLIVAAVCRCLH